MVNDIFGYIALQDLKKVGKILLGVCIVSLWIGIGIGKYLEHKKCEEAGHMMRLEAEELFGLLMP